MVPWAEILWVFCLFFRYFWENWLGIPEIACFWDVDNQNITRRSATAITRRVVRQFHNLASNFTSSELVIRAYGNLRVTNRVRKALRRESSVRLHIVPTTKKNAADEEMVLAIRSWIRDKHYPTFVIVVTGDGDFCEVLRQRVRSNGHYIILVHPNLSVSGRLKEAVAKSLAWEKFLKGGLTVGADVGMIRGNIENMYDVFIHFYMGWTLFNECSIQCFPFVAWLIVSTLIVKPRLRSGRRHLWNRCLAVPQCIFSRLSRSVVEMCFLARLFMFSERYAIILKIWYIAYGALKSARKQRRILIPKQQPNQGEKSMSVFMNVKILLERDWAHIAFLIACIAMDMCGLC